MRVCCHDLDRTACVSFNAQSEDPTRRTHGDPHRETVGSCDCAIACAPDSACDSDSDCDFDCDCDCDCDSLSVSISVEQRMWQMMLFLFRCVGVLLFVY